jgi:Lipocalin-like domain
LSSTIALAGENPLLGTWKLKSWVREVTATGEEFNQMGEHPNGYLSYSADGRMYAIITADRIKGTSNNTTISWHFRLCGNVSNGSWLRENAATVRPLADLQRQQDAGILPLSALLRVTGSKAFRGTSFLSIF